jgi:thioredoxin-like negative regulator of GroEL
MPPDDPCSTDFAPDSLPTLSVSAMQIKVMLAKTLVFAGQLVAAEQLFSQLSQQAPAQRPSLLLEQAHALRDAVRAADAWILLVLSRNASNAH